MEGLFQYSTEFLAGMAFGLVLGIIVYYLVR